MTRRIFGIATAVVLAAVGTGVLVLYVKGAEQRALAGERTVDVLVVQQTVRKGTPAADLTEFVEEQKIPAKVQAVDAVASLDELDGKVAAVDLVPGEQLVATRFADPDDYKAQTAVEIPDGLQLVTVSLDPTRVLGGEIGPGDTVGVVASFEDVASDEADPQTQPTGESKQTTHFILHKILVANVQGEPQPAKAEEEEEDDDNARSGAPGTNLLVTFAVDAPSAERLVFAAEYGTIWLSLQTDTTTEDGTQIQTKDRIYR